MINPGFAGICTYPFESLATTLSFYRRQGWKYRANRGSMSTMHKFNLQYTATIVKATKNTQNK